MKFRTEAEIKPFDRRIGYETRLLSLGSCFAENMAERLKRAKLQIAVNPMGTLFNPASIASAIERFAEHRAYTESEITKSADRWFAFDAHTSLDGCSPSSALQRLNTALDEGHRALCAADCIILTFGTAWIYRLAESGKVVANCHKLPQSMFRRERLSAEEIAELYAPLLEGILRDKLVILTVSPVRHTADGLEENSISKAILRLAVDMLAQRFDNVRYFPSYEIVNDDLRDYRFYADDLVHPNRQAMDYIWEKFASALLSPKAQSLLPKAEQIVAAAEHRPFNPDSGEYAAFCKRMLECIEALPDINFSAEREFFARHAK